MPFNPNLAVNYFLLCIHSCCEATCSCGYHCLLHANFSKATQISGNDEEIIRSSELTYEQSIPARSLSHTTWEAWTAGTVTGTGFWRADPCSPRRTWGSTRGQGASGTPDMSSGRERWARSSARLPQAFPMAGTHARTHRHRGSRGVPWPQHHWGGTAKFLRRDWNLP